MQDRFHTMIPPAKSDIAATTPPVDETVRFFLEVSGSKLRIVLYSPSIERLSPFFKKALPNPDSEFKEIPGCSHIVPSFGRCWGILSNSEIHLEFWYPTDSRINIVELTTLIDELRASLKLPKEKLSSDIERLSIAKLDISDYRVVFSMEKMSAIEATRSCQVFLEASQRIAGARGKKLNDGIMYRGGASEGSVHRTTFNPLMMFGGYSSSAKGPELPESHAPSGSRPR